MQGKKNKHETNQNKHQEKFNQPKQEERNRLDIINGLSKQQKRKYAHKKSFKSRKRHRQQPAENQEIQM